MGMVKQDINDFNARVKRIKNPRNKSYYDPDLGMHIPKRVPRDQIKKKVQHDEDSYLGKFIVAMVIGAVALMFAQVVRIRFFGLSLDSDVMLALELFVAFWAMLLLSTLLRKRHIFDRIGQLAGIGAMMVAGHNLIWRWPEQMAYIYTDAHVQQVLQQTEELSLVWGAAVLTL